MQILLRKNNIENNMKILGPGPSMAPFWRVWGGSWAPLGRSWAPWSRFLGALGRFLGASLVSWVLRAWFGEGLGGSWEVLGKFWGGFWKNFGKMLGGYLRFRDPRAASPTRLASQCAGVPPPAWLNPAFLEVWGRRPYRVGFARPVEGHRTPSKSIELFHLGRQVGSKFAFFRNLFAFFSHDASKLRFLSFPDGFWMDFGRFGEGSEGVLEVVFHMIFKKMNCLKNSVSPRENR